MATRFAYAVLAGNQLVAVTNIIKFRYDDGTTFLHWQTGEDVDHAIWFIVFLVVVALVNMLPVKVGIAGKGARACPLC